MHNVIMFTLCQDVCLALYVRSAAEFIKDGALNREQQSVLLFTFIYLYVHTIKLYKFVLRNLLL